MLLDRKISYLPCHCIRFLVLYKKLFKCFLDEISKILKFYGVKIEMAENQTEPIPFKLNCPNCKKEISYPDFVTSIIQYGLIFLDGNESCWFGCTCPFCADYSTLIQKFSKKNLPEELSHIYDSIINDKGWLYSFKPPQSKNGNNPKASELDSSIEYSSYEKWFYNPFPHYFEHESIPLFSNFSEISSKQNKNFDYPESEPLFYDMENIPLEQYQEILDQSYHTYQRGCRVLGPALTIFWFNEEQILELAELESKKKRKSFPRYSLYDATWEDIQHFCWTYKYQQKYLLKVSDTTETPSTS